MPESSEQGIPESIQQEVVPPEGSRRKKIFDQLQAHALQEVRYTNDGAEEEGWKLTFAALDRDNQVAEHDVSSVNLTRTNPETGQEEKVSLTGEELDAFLHLNGLL